MKALIYIATAALAFVTNTSFAQNVDTLDPAFFKINEIFWRAKNPSSKYGPTANAIDPQTGRSITVNSPGFKTDGGVHSGGGTLVNFQQTLGVLDLYRFNRKAFFDRTPGHKLPYTRAFREYKIDQLKSDSSILKSTIAQVEKWNNSSPYVVRFVKRALQNLPVYYVDYKLNFKLNAAEVPSEIKLQNVKLAAWYMAKFGAFLDKNAFQMLSEKNQIAFLIHEALRHEQFTHYSDFANETIQKLTARLVDDPQTGMTLDVPEYYTHQRREFFEKVRTLLPEAQALLATYCELMKRCDLRPSQIVITDTNHEEAKRVTLFFEELMDAIRPVVESDSQKLRDAHIQEERDHLNHRIAVYVNLVMDMNYVYRFKLSDLRWDIEMDDVAYMEVDRISGINYDYKWLPELLQKTNKGYRYMGGTSPISTFMKQMMSAGFFK